ncbi:Leucine-rich repeat domain, L domain-like [Phytophthora cactorum]|nr:Leucine-rich repeat domain, L domain-like [Phytophthora cactorum]
MFGIIGGMHALQVLNILIMSIRARRITLRQPTSRTTGPFAYIWINVFSRKGIFGVESEHFSTVFAVREVLEASSQTYQAYRASNLLPRAGMNALIVGLLVTNCWTTAGIQLFLRKSPALERVVTLTYDALLSFGMMIVVPLIIFIPYIEAFNFEYSIFKNPDVLYDPVPLATMVLENRLIFASSLFDFATKLIPQLSIFLSLVTVSELLGRSDVKVIPSTNRHSIQSVAVKPKAGSDGIGKPSEVDKTIGNPKNSGQFASLRALHKWKHRAANYEVIGCRAVTRPWFSNGKEPCSSLVYDCHARNTTSPDGSSFDKLDHVTLATLAIAHCPELKMPPDFQRLENLVMFHLYNSTIVNWDAESSVSATAHTRLLSVLVGKTQMAEFPVGLLQPLPASLMSVQFSQTNLTKLPDDLYVRWHAMAMISFENGILTEIPYQMFFSPVYTLSLMGNRIETLPTLAMMPPGMIIPELRLTHNPLRELPAALMAPDPFIMSLNVQNTSLTTMPTWVKTNTKVVWAYDTPFCATPMADPALAYQVMCFARPPGQEAFFPMYLFDSLYQFGKA